MASGTYLGIRSAKYIIVRPMSIMALLTGERSKPPYIKLPSTVENNMGMIPMAGKANPVITAYGIISPNPKGNVRIVIARSWRQSSPDRIAITDRCIVRVKIEIS
jgi:hypothetical protein